MHPLAHPSELVGGCWYPADRAQRKARAAMDSWRDENPYMVLVTMHDMAVEIQAAAKAQVDGQ
jgi:hypothetical protein